MPPKKDDGKKSEEVRKKRPGRDVGLRLILQCRALVSSHLICLDMQDPNKELLKLHQKHGESLLPTTKHEKEEQYLLDVRRLCIGDLTQWRLHRR